MRHETRSADAEASAALRAASPVRAGVLVVAAAAAFIGAILLVGGAPQFAAPAFLGDALGPERPAAPLTRSPAPGVDVRIDDEGYTVARGGESVSVAAEDVGGADWRRHAHGVSRPTEFGAETIVVDGNTTEEFLTVAKHQGPRLWRWRLETRLVPRVRADGAVEFRDPTLHAVSPISLKPVAILDAAGDDITPAGLRWRIVREEDAWWLLLRLDDTDLPLPYVIDPAANYPTPLNLRSVVSAETGSWQMDGGTGAVNITTDNIPANGATGWYPWDPGLSRTTRLATIPGTTDGMGWIVDPAGGATGFPAGNWSFTVVTDIPNATLTAGTAVLTVGMWKGTVSGGVFTSTGTILAPTDDPAAQNLRTVVTPKTTTATFSLGKLSLAPGETLFVDFWRHQTGGIATNTAARRQLDFYVNDGAAFIAHPAADDTGPSHSLALVELTNAAGQHFDAATNTHYYNTSAGGTFRVDDTVTDGGSGVLQVAFPAVALTGFTHTAVTDTTSPYRSNTYTWTTANTTSPGAQAIVAEDNALNQSSPSPGFRITRDATAPTGQSVALSAGPWYTSTSVTLTLGDGTDGGSGLDTSSGLIERDEAALANGGCGSFSGTWTTVSSPDATVQSGKCYRYRYSISDNVGNRSAPAVTAADAKVDTSAPAAPALTLFEAEADEHVSGATLYYNPQGGNAGMFTVDAAGGDAESGVERVSFPLVFGGDSSDDLIAPYDHAYSWTSSDGASGSKTVTLRNGAGQTADATFTVTPDTAAPAGGSITYPDGYDGDGQVTIGTADGSDAFSGLDLGSAALERRTTALSGGVCTAFSGGWAPVSSPDSVASGLCAEYRYRISDNVANEAVSTNGNVVKVDLEDPSAPALILSESSPHAHVSGSEIFLNTAQSGSYDVSATSTDPVSGIAKIAFPGGIDDATSPYGATYAFGDLAAGSHSVAAHDGAGQSAASSFTVTADTAAPAGGSVSYADGYDADGQITVGTADGSDAGAGIDAASAVLERRTSSLSADTCAPFSGAWTTVTSPDTVASGFCAQYRYRVGDNVGNETAYSSSDVAKVDLTAPAAPTLLLSETEADSHVSASTLYYNPQGGNAGTFTVDAVTADGQSGVERVSFPNVFGADGGDDLVQPYDNAYTWTSADTASGPHGVSARNGAGLTAVTTFTVEPDTTVPSTTDDTAAIGSDWKTADVTVTLSPADAGAGVAATYYTTDGSVPTTASSQGASVTLSADGVYTIRYFTVDNVGNAEPVRTASTPIRIDRGDPSAPSLTLSESSPYAHVSGSEMFVNTAQAGTYGVAAVASDATSGLEKIRFPGGVDDSTSPYSQLYAFGDVSGTQTVTAFDFAGNFASSTFEVTPDTVAPVGGSVSYANGYDADGQVPITTADGSDAGAGIDSTSAVLEHRLSALTDGSCDAFSGGWTVVSSPDSVADGTCAEYRYRISDNVSNEAVHTSGNVVKVDLTAPQTTLDGAPSDPSNDPSPTFQFSADESSSTFECRLDGGAWTACTNPHGYGLADGSHTVAVRATDPAGNTDPTPATHTWTIDTAAPQTTIDAAPADPSNDPSPTFQFSADESSSTFECRLDGGAWTACTNPHGYGLADGSHTVAVRATDPAGNTDPTPATHTWTIDTAAPQTTLDSAPADPSNDASPTFAFSADQAGSTFECRLDGAGWTACTSPQSYTSLADGGHTLDVRATDPAGNTDPTPATHTWTIDTAAPQTTLDSAPADPSNDASPTFAFSADQAGSTFECRLDGAGWTTCTTPQTYIGPLSDGSHTVDVRATDPAGNTDPTPATHTWTVDATAPDTTFTAVPPDPSADPTPTFQFTATEGGSTFQCRLDGGAWTACTSPVAFGPLADGNHTVEIRATDPAGNTDQTPATHTWVVDATAPSLSITQPAAFVNAADPDPYSIEAVSPDGDVATVEFFRCDDASSGCSTGNWISLGTDSAAPYQASWPLDADGNRALRAFAIDWGGNTGADVVDVIVDRTRPTSSIDSAPSDPSASAAASFSFSAGEAGVAFECELNGGGFASCATPMSYAGLADGSHVFRVRAVDLAGNAEISPRDHAWTIDTAVPETTLDAVPADPSASASATFAFSSNEGAATFECRLDSGSWATCSSPANLSGLLDGSHTFRVRAVDAAGNADASAAAHTWTVDATPPGGGLADPGANLRGGVTLAASPTDAGVGVRGVDFQISPANEGAWTSLTVDSAAPYSASWDTTATADGLYDLRVVVTDNAGNTTASAEVEDRRVDNTAPSATMSDPGTYLRGTVTLASSASDGGSGVASVVYERSPAGSGSWTTVSSAWNTAGVTDGLYDLRVVVADAAGNSTISAPVTDRAVDNTKPTLVSSNPADGTTVVSAGSLELNVSEAAAGIANATLDGAAAPGQTVSGSTVTFSGPFADGPHTLAGEIEDLAGNTRTIRVHFTVWSLAAADYPFVEKNVFAGVATSLRAASDEATVRMPAGAWSGAAPGDWLVLRIDPQPAGGLGTGFRAASGALDVTAYWALAGTSVTEFDQPLEIDIDNTTDHVIPATLVNGSWRSIRRVPSGRTLPASWNDGYYVEGTDVVVLSRHLTFFALLEDVKPPSKPRGFAGAVSGGTFTLSWKAAADNSGLIAGYRVYAGGSLVRTAAGNDRTVGMGAFRTTDSRAFRVAAVDEAGNVGAKTDALLIVPALSGHPLAEAKTALSTRGFAVGGISHRHSASVPVGSVIEANASGLRPAGATIALTVSSGPETPAEADSGSPTGSTTAPPPAAGSDGSVSDPPAYYPAAPGSSPATDPDPSVATGAPTASAPELAPHVAPELRGNEEVSDLRTLIGLGILTLAFAVAAFAALRRYPLLPGRPARQRDEDESLLLWDARLLRSATSAARRLAERF